MVSCIGYYAGSFVFGFDSQPPVGFVVVGGLCGGLVGGVLGGLAGISILRGGRARFVAVATICVLNTLASLGTIDVSFELSTDSLTIRTILVGGSCGLVAGTILSVLLLRKPMP